MDTSDLRPLQSQLAFKLASKRNGHLPLLNSGQGRVRVGGIGLWTAPPRTTNTMTETATSLPRSVEIENIDQPLPRTKSFDYKNVIANADKIHKKDYKFIPPAATRGYLW
jgi:hypothetical protein